MEALSIPVLSVLQLSPAVHHECASAHSLCCAVLLCAGGGGVQTEHSLELHTPYIVKVMGGRQFSLVPIMVGALTTDG